MSLRSMLRTTGTLERPTTTKDSSGGRSDSFATVSGASGVRCDIQSASASIQREYETRQMHVTHSVYFASDIGAREQDRFTSNSRTFLVMGYRPASIGYSSWPYVMDVEEITNGA